jgi:hypothetical protein
VQAVRPAATDFEGPPMPPEWLKGLFVGAGFDEAKTRVEKDKMEILLKEMSAPAREHSCEAVMLQASVGWDVPDRENLYEELLKRFDVKTAEVEGFLSMRF